MCIAIPKKVIKVEKGENKALVLDNGNELEVNISLIDSIEEGDYVIVQSGYATQAMNEKEAEESLSLWRSFNQEET